MEDARAAGSARGTRAPRGCRCGTAPRPCCGPPSRSRACPPAPWRSRRPSSPPRRSARRRRAAGPGCGSRSECSWTMSGRSARAKSGTRGAGSSPSRPPPARPRSRRSPVFTTNAPSRRNSLSTRVPRADGQLEARRVGLEVVAHLVLRREVVARRRELHPDQAVELGGREQAQRVPALAPGVADALGRVQDHEAQAALAQVVARPTARPGRRRSRRRRSARARPGSPGRRAAGTPHPIR